jgi:C-terminal processing protease CtpA/Prc
MPNPRQIAACCLAYALIHASTALADEPAVQKLDAVTQGRLTTLYSQLGSDDFGAREKAQAALQLLADTNKEPILDHALDRYLEITDPEIRYRLRSAMFNAVASETKRSGFIGISMFSRFDTSVGIMRVIQGSAAQRHGLRPGDEIVKLDGKPFSTEVGAAEPSRQLQDYVSALDEGTALKLSIRRGGFQEMEVDLELGGMPDDLNNQRREVVFADWMHEELVDRGLAKPKPAPEPASSSPRPLPRFLPRRVPVPPRNLFPDSD